MKMERCNACFHNGYALETRHVNHFYIQDDCFKCIQAIATETIRESSTG
jgi:hypothetical protein